jgi:ribose-phosphate pyrophosphokinase
MNNDFVICATRSMKQYAARVIADLAKFPDFAGRAESFGGTDLLHTECFANGELEVEVNASIRGKDVIIFSSSARNEAGIGVGEAKLELYQAIDALKRSQAARIIVFEPFVSCSRSDRSTRRNSVGLWAHLKILVSLGAQHLVTYQLHSDKSKSMIDPTLCALDDIPGMPLLKQYLCDTYIHNLDRLENEVRPRWAFCSVDAGGEKLTRRFANAFGAPLVVAHKQRHPSRANTVESINILTAEPIEGKSLWIVDDMIDTAGSVESLIHALAPLGPREINLIAVHALFSPPAAQRLAALAQEGLLKRIMVTDTVSCPDTLSAGLPCIEIVSSTGLAAQIIRTIITNSSMNQLLQPFDAGAYLKHRLS